MSVIIGHNLAPLPGHQTRPGKTDPPHFGSPSGAVALVSYSIVEMLPPCSGLAAGVKRE